MKIAVVGDGIIGVAIAYFLRISGADVILIGDQNAIIPSATEVSGGLLRVMDSNLPLARAALKGVLTFREWADLGLPGETGYVGCGAVYLEEISSNSRYQDYIHALDCPEYPVSQLTNSSLSRIFPAIEAPENAFIIYEPNGGYGSPRTTRASILRAYRKLGGEVINARALRAVLDHGECCIIEHCHGRTDVDIIVVATGARSDNLLANSGIQLSASMNVTPKTIAIPYFSDIESNLTGNDLPVLVDMDRGTFVRSLGGDKYLVGAGNDGDVVEGDVAPSLKQAHIDDAKRRVSSSVPDLRQAKPCGGYLGVDGYTPSLKPVIGWLPSSRCAYLAIGFSGRGYKISIPVAATIAKELLRATGMAGHDMLHTIGLSDGIFTPLICQPELEVSAS